jgi:hypothetical protein
MAFEQIHSEPRDTADQILPDVSDKPPTIVGMALLGQFALLREQSERQADQEYARRTKRGEKQQRRARGPEDHGGYSTN